MEEKCPVDIWSYNRLRVAAAWTTSPGKEHVSPFGEKKKFRAPLLSVTEAPKGATGVKNQSTKVAVKGSISYPRQKSVCRPPGL